ncbi:hypothetical protein BJX99DRAFT_235259 [Aspergillus californicus]
MHSHIVTLLTLQLLATTSVLAVNTWQGFLKENFLECAVPCLTTTISTTDLHCGRHKLNSEADLADCICETLLEPTKQPAFTDAYNFCTYSPNCTKAERKELRAYNATQFLEGSDDLCGNYTRAQALKNKNAGGNGRLAGLVRSEKADSNSDEEDRAGDDWPADGYYEDAAVGVAVRFNVLFAVGAFMIFAAL